jgi:hypothetical protein
MALDFDHFIHLDLNFDGIVDAHELQMYELTHHGDYSLHDLNHDGMMDQFQTDLNHDGFMDQFQVDADHNGIMDKFENNIMGTKLQYDVNHDGHIDSLDLALGKQLFSR